MYTTLSDVCQEAAKLKSTAKLAIPSYSFVYTTPVLTSSPAATHVKVHNNVAVQH